MTHVREIVIVDNNTVDSVQSIQEVIDQCKLLVPVLFFSFKHGDLTRTQSWSTNAAVNRVSTPWVFFTRADYLLSFDAVRKFSEVAEKRRHDWQGFIVSDFYHLTSSIAECEETNWRVVGVSALSKLPGRREDYSVIDSGVWMTRKSVFDSVGGFDEDLSAWGHAQTHFQDKVYRNGAEFVSISEVLFYHPFHSASRDINLAHAQLASKGVEIKDLWKRYKGWSPYGT